MLFKESERYIRKIENFAYREINELNFSNPHPRISSIPLKITAFHVHLIPNYRGYSLSSPYLSLPLSHT